MKQLKTTLLAFFVIAVMGFTVSGSALAFVTYDGAWKIDDGNLNYINYTAGPNSAFFLTNNNNEFIDVSLPSMMGITFNFNNNILSVDPQSNTGYITSSDTSLDLHPDGWFWLGYFDSSNNRNYTYNYFESDISSYILDFDGKVLLQVDAQPVPLPGAAWLMGAGLLTLVGLRRKYNVTG